MPKRKRLAARLASTIRAPLPGAGRPRRPAGLLRGLARGARPGGTATARRNGARRGADGDAERSFDDGVAHTPLHWMAAGLFLATGVESLASRVFAARDDGARRPGWRSLELAPLAIAPVAVAAHVLEAARPERRSRRLARVLDGVAVGAAGLAVAAGTAALLSGRRDPGWRRRPRGARLAWLGAVAPAAFGATGVLGLLLDREERREAAERRRLERRAKVLDRMVPRRRARIDRIVVHV